MRVGFAGTPAFAARALAAIHAYGATIPIVLTQPDRPFGRGLAVSASPVKRYASDHGLAVQQPPSLRAHEVQSALRDTPIDVLVVAAYGLILPQPVLDWPRHGGLNIHASLLPRWRGAAPIARAIEAGDRVTGITIMQMDAGLDTGPIVAARALPPAERETAGSLTGRLADLGAAMIVDALGALAEQRSLPGVAQASEGATYAEKITRNDTLIDWTNEAQVLDRRIRALDPLPGAVAAWRGKPVKIRAALPVDTHPAGEPGTIVTIRPEGIDVTCGSAARRAVLRLTQVQPAGGRSMTARAFAAGYRVEAGAAFGPGR